MAASCGARLLLEGSARRSPDGLPLILPKVLWLQLHRGRSGEMARWPEHGAYRGAPYHPMTQGKIERWHQTLKNRILLENYYLPDDLEAQIEAFVADYNHLRYHEGIGNLTPADVYCGRGQTILIERDRIKQQTIANRRLLHKQQAA
jgi:putative transposase